MTQMDDNHEHEHHHEHHSSSHSHHSSSSSRSRSSRHSHKSSNIRIGKHIKIPKIALVFLIILAACVIGFFVYSSEQDKKSQAQLKEIGDQMREEELLYLEKEKGYEEQLSDLRKAQRSKDSFYQKLDDGFDVNILVIGDSIGQCSGASDGDHQWTSLLKRSIKAKYDVEANITNVSMGGNASYAGYVRTMALKDGINYDLAIICYGQNDSPNNFDLYYESIIRAVKNRYPKASMICILESSQKDYTEKMRTIQRIAGVYGLPVADTILPFRVDYDSFVKDGVHPNDKGQEVYCEEVFEIIEDKVALRYGFDKFDIQAINNQVNVFNDFRWIGKDEFTRNGNTFVLNSKLKGTVLGIDYSFTPGRNSCKIYIDNIEYVAPEVTFNYDFSQRHIIVVNDWLNGSTLDVQNEIRITFLDDEYGTTQADKFNGIAISGE